MSFRLINLLQIQLNYISASDKNDPIIAIFFDFSKTFDLVDHETQLEKLTKHLPKWLMSWIAVYLSEKRQHVDLNGYETNWKEVVAVAIQGSVLGPVLFLLFISE